MTKCCNTIYDILYNLCIILIIIFESLSTLFVFMVVSILFGLNIFLECIAHVLKMIVRIIT